MGINCFFPATALPLWHLGRQWFEIFRLGYATPEEIKDHLLVRALRQKDRTHEGPWLGRGSSKNQLGFRRSGPLRGHDPCVIYLSIPFRQTALFPCWIHWGGQSKVRFFFVWICIKEEDARKTYNFLAECSLLYDEPHTGCKWNTQ